MKMKKRLAALSVPFLFVANQVMAYDLTAEVAAAKAEMETNMGLIIPVGLGIVVGVAGFALLQKFLKAK